MDYSAARVAELLGRNVSSVKTHLLFRRVLEQRQGVSLTGPDARALSALAALSGGGGSASAAEVGAEAGVSTGLVRRRLAGLAQRGYATSRSGEPSQAGYAVTPAGLKALRDAQPRRKKRTGK
jgi:DNA-binding MarR family transcriptional regulator